MRLARIGLMLVVPAISIVLLIRSLDSAMEIDDLKSHIRLQKEALVFFESINHQAMATCALSVEAFENVVKTSKYASSKWNGEHKFVGPFQVERRNDCIAGIRLVGLP